MKRTDLLELERLLEDAAAVVPMEDIYDHGLSDDVIGLRHDVDDNVGSLPTALEIAKWEAERGYRATYYVLHSADYWTEDMWPILREIAGLGHEIGIHTNALAVALHTGDDPDLILSAALDEMRLRGHFVRGVAAHGDPLCRVARFVNDEHFTECARPEMGEPNRTIRLGTRELKIEPRSMRDFGLEYDTHRLPHGRYLSDSGGRWNEPFPGVGEGQLHVLWHPDWWVPVFRREHAFR